MEIYYLLHTTLTFIQFKIDFIVWKFIHQGIGIYKQSWFKIDFIVWKLIQALVRNDKLILFKIDFIVWKLFNSIIFFKWNTSLKQTLQYGNEELKIGQKEDFECLKQTLQYGNVDETLVSGDAFALFKIDFIVWKYW